MRKTAERPGLVEEATETQECYGVIDIGSNSIRLVVFEGLRRAPLPMLNERILCGLGRSLHDTGMLDPEGVEQALLNIERFGILLRAMGVARFDVIATAAVRDAEDGGAFVAEVERRCGFRVRVLSGAEEAEMAALGVLSGVPDADGLVGDLGGGSLEMVHLVDGVIAEQATLPLGPLNLFAASGGQRRVARRIIDKALDELPWLSRMHNAPSTPSVVTGGRWRMSTWRIRTIRSTSFIITACTGVNSRKSPIWYHARVANRSRASGVFRTGGLICCRSQRW